MRIYDKLALEMACKICESDILRQNLAFAQPFSSKASGFGMMQINALIINNN